MKIVSVVLCTCEHQDVRTRHRVGADLCSPFSWQNKLLVWLTALHKAPVDCCLCDSLNPVLSPSSGHGVNFWQSKINTTWCDWVQGSVVPVSFPGYSAMIVTKTDANQYYCGFEVLIKEVNQLSWRTMSVHTWQNIECAKTKGCSAANFKWCQLNGPVIAGRAINHIKSYMCILNSHSLKVHVTHYTHIILLYVL